MNLQSNVVCVQCDTLRFMENNSNLEMKDFAKLSAGGVF